jgi:hypothetical protein
VYAVVATHGAAHSQVFEVECAIPKLKIQVLGSGASRRAAEQAAARNALDAAHAMVPAAARRTRARAGDAARETTRATGDETGREAGREAGRESAPGMALPPIGLEESRPASAA